MTMSSSRSALGSRRGWGQRERDRVLLATGVGKVPLLIVALNVNFQFQLGHSRKTTQFAYLPRWSVLLSLSGCALLLLLLFLSSSITHHTISAANNNFCFMSLQQDNASGTGWGWCRGRGSYSSCATITWSRPEPEPEPEAVHGCGGGTAVATCSCCWRVAYALPREGIANAS